MAESDHTNRPTWARLIPQGLGPQRTALLRCALGELGIKESPKGSNRGPVEKYFPQWVKNQFLGVAPSKKEGDPGKGPAWCGFFVSWNWRQALKKMPIPGAGSVKLLSNTAKDLGMWIEKGTHVPGPGDAFVILRPNGTGHIGFILRLSETGDEFNTIEGNAGDEVKIGKRRMDDPLLAGFIRSVIGEETIVGVERGLIPGENTGAGSDR